MSTNESSPIYLKFVGEDNLSRAVFKGNNGGWYKTVEMIPKSPLPLTAAEETKILRSLHTTDSFDGEPCCQVDVSQFRVFVGN